MKKQAYLLTAYKDFDAVYELACFLSSKDMVWIHVDAKSQALGDKELAKLNALPNVEAFKEYEIAWGGYNHVKALLALMKRAVDFSSISYIHFLTGEDFPLYSPEELHDRFVDDEHIYLDYIEQEDFPEAVTKRYYYKNYFQDKNVKNPWLWQLQNLTVNVQKLMGVKKTTLGEFDRVYKGLVYMSMPMAAAQDILSYLDAHPEYERELYDTQVPEEFFFHTMLLNESFVDGKWKEAIVKGELRYMDWSRGDGSSPCYIEDGDFAKLAEAKSNGKFFARKFHGVESRQLREKIQKELWGA